MHRAVSFAAMRCTCASASQYRLMPVVGKGYTGSVSRHEAPKKFVHVPSLPLSAPGCHTTLVSVLPVEKSSWKTQASSYLHSSIAAQRLSFTSHTRVSSVIVATTASTTDGQESDSTESCLEASVLVHDAFGGIASDRVGEDLTSQASPDREPQSHSCDAEDEFLQSTALPADRQREEAATPASPPPSHAFLPGGAAAFLRLSDSDLLRQCDVDTYRASGPGGQHRNKTESAVRLRHRPSGCVAQSCEQRSQHQNRETALRRLRQTISLQGRWE